MAAHCRIELLGGLRVLRGGEVLARFRTKKTAEILGRLAYSLGRPVPREDLIEEHWPDAGSDQARNSLSQAVSSLRQVLEGPGQPPGAVLEATRATLRISAEACTTDLDDFREALRRADAAQSRGDAQAWAAESARAAGLAQGELLPGAGGLWAVTAREAHREQATALLERLGKQALEEGRHDSALALLLQAAENDPVNESVRQAAIVAYDALGRPEAALRQYRLLAKALRAELGVAPRAETKDLVQDVVSKPRQAAAPKVGDAPPSAPGGIPAPSSRFFGRESELQAVQEALDAGARLVTLLGTGGMGKTRLSIEAARQAAPGFPGRAWFVELAPARTDSEAWEALANALGAAPGPAGVQDAVAAVLAPAPAMVVLDNFEQLAGRSTLVPQLLRSFPGLRLLVSSRRRLEVDGEAVVELMPLPVPGEKDGSGEASESPAVALFVDRARLLRPDFDLDEGNAPLVARLCGALEGIPLAIELAASRVHVLSVAQMLERASERLDLLSSRGKEDRHRSLRAAATWTYELLSPPLRDAFVRLAAFVGGFSLDLAEAALDDPLALDLVAELRDFSLLTGGEGADGALRFGMLETLRDFAKSAASQEAWEEATARHLAAMLSHAEAHEALLSGPEQGAALAKMELEAANYAAAVRRACKRGLAGPALRLGGACWRFWHLRGHLAEGRRLLDAALATEGGDGVARARALNGAGRLAYLQGDYADSARLHEEALALRCGDPDSDALAKNALGAVAYELGDYQRAVALFEESLAMRRALGDQFGAGNALSWLGIVLTDQGRYDEARDALEESLRLRREIGDRGGVARSLNSLGIVARQTGRAQEAAALYAQALELHRSLGDRRAVAGALGNLAIVQIGEGKLDEAEGLLEEARGILDEIGDRWGTATNLAIQGQLALGRGEPQEALRLQQEALRQRQEMGNLWGVALSLEGVAAALAGTDPATAARLLGAAGRIRDEMGSPAPPADAAGIERLRAELREACGSEFDAALESGRGLDPGAACKLALGEDAPPATPPG